MSVPPFATVAAVAGWARVSLGLFLITGFLGRHIRFGALTTAPTVIPSVAAA